jgi:hypothetical protein
MFSNRQFYPDKILLSAHITDENLLAAMEYLLSGTAEPGCKILLGDSLITPAQLDKILAALADPRCPQGLQIYFDNCYLNSAAAVKFAALFEAGHYPANMHLSFFRNNIGDNGLFTMLDALSRDGNRPGVFLNMQYNHNLSDECINAITTIIALNQLADGVGIDLRNNPQLSDDALLLLLNSLQRNTAVTALQMDIPCADFLEQERRLQLEFCCARNRLLQQYRGNTDLIYQIHRLSAARGMPLPRPATEENHAPSLRFFAANAVPPAELQTFFDRFEGGFETLLDLTESMQNNTNQLDPGSKKRGCPWPCTIL